MFRNGIAMFRFGTSVGWSEISELFTGPESLRHQVAARPRGIRIGYSLPRFISWEYGGRSHGLALVSRIVERHGGAIRVESTEGVGSTFFVELPWQAERGSRDVDRTVGHPAR